MKKYIVFALIALFAAVLFIACDNDVKVDNSAAFTQRIASEGAFVVNGKSYDSLQDAINAATGAKMPAPDPVKITLTKDYAGRAVSIPEDAQVAIDLNGHTLTFVDLKETTPALSVEEGAYFALGNGTVTILDKTSKLTLIDADDAHIVLSSVLIDLEENQNAVVSEDTHVHLIYSEDADPTCVSGNIFLFGSDNNKASLLTFEDTVVLGSVTAVGTNAAGETSDVALIVANTLPDVRMTNAFLDVVSTAHVTLNALAGTNKFVATPPGSSSITNNSGVDIEVLNGLYSIARSGVSSYYGSLQEALDSLDVDNLEIVLRDNDDSTNPVVASNGKSFTIKFLYPGYGIHATSITADADMAIVNPGYTNSVIYSEIYGDIDVAGTFVVTGNYGRIHIDGTVTAGEVTASYAVFDDAINSSGAVEAEYCTFGYYNTDNDYPIPSITADSNVAITNSNGAIGDINASGTITIETNGNLAVGNLNAGLNAVSITGNTNYFVDVYGTVTGGSVTASYAKFYHDITSSGAVVAEDCTFGYYNTDNDYPIPSITADGNISINSSYGFIGDIVASGAINLSTPSVNYTAVEYQLTVDAVNASSNNVTINGHSEDYVIVNGAVTAGEVTAYYAKFGDDIFATTAANLNNSYVGNGAGDGVFAPVIAIFDSTLNVNYLQGTEAGAPATSVSVTGSKDIIGTIVASDSITLSTPEITSYTLAVDSLNAGTGDIAINNVNTYSYGGGCVYVNGNVSCATLYANNARFNSSYVVEATDLTGGYYYGTVVLSGSGIINIASGDYNTVEYNGTGTLNIIGGTIHDIDNITAKVNIKGGTIYEPEIDDLTKVVNRINQDDSDQQVTIHFDPIDDIVFLTGYEPFDMTSANIAGTASLVFDMKFVSDTSSNDIVSGLIVGQAPSASASVVFDFYNGPGKKQISVSGRIGLYGGSKIYSTQQTDDLVYTSDATAASTEYTYKLATPLTAITGVTAYSGYEYANTL